MCDEKENKVSDNTEKFAVWVDGLIAESKSQVKRLKTQTGGAMGGMRPDFTWPNGAGGEPQPQVDVDLLVQELAMANGHIKYLQAELGLEKRMHTQLQAEVDNLRSRQQ